MLGNRPSFLNPLSINMNGQVKAAIEACAAASLAGEITFPQAIARLSALGIERYFADYCRSEIVYYDLAGETHVVASPHAAVSMGMEFSADVVEKSVRKSQRNEHKYADFVRETMQAGCVGYFVLLTGRQVIYFGRKGEMHIEKFPGTP
jgi:uncharacterized protein YbcV (DUF1398 family)